MQVCRVKQCAVRCGYGVPRPAAQAGPQSSFFHHSAQMRPILPFLALFCV